MYYMKVVASIVRQIQELTAERDKLYSSITTYQMLYSEERAKTELETLRKDAERYRYLRDRVPAEVLGQVKSAAGCWIDGEDEEGTLILLTGDDADAAIDAAMLAARAVGAA
jgi:hypothetical protein